MTIAWTIQALDCKPTEGNLTDVVITAHWRCTGTQDIYGASVYGTCSFSQPGDPFTPYPDLTQDQVLGWCWAAGVDKAETEALVQQQLDKQINPPVVTPALPWAASN
jgi:hypothetical protein